MADFDLVIVGAGFSGLNALAAAVELHPHLKIAVLEATDRVGGHWHNAYSFVRLHHHCYGIGKYGLVGKNNTRNDILSYAEHVYADIIARADLNVTFMWNTRYLGISSETVRTSNGTLTTKRLIDTVRYGLPTGCYDKPLGVLPRDLPDLPPASSYVIIGSGKTAMDTLRYLGRPATVIGGTPVSFFNRNVPLKVILGRAIANVVDGEVSNNGDVLYFMGQRGVWRYGFADACEMAEAEACVKEYLPNTHVEGFERGDTLRVFLRGGGERVFDKDTVIIDCRGITTFRNNPDIDIHSLDVEDRVLYTFVTDLPDSHSAYTMSAMFLRGDLGNLRTLTPPPTALHTSATMADILRHVLEMSKARRGAPISDATYAFTYNAGVLDWIRLWWIKDKIKEGVRMLKINYSL